MKIIVQRQYRPNEKEEDTNPRSLKSLLHCETLSFRWLLQTLNNRHFILAEIMCNEIMMPKYFSPSNNSKKHKENLQSPSGTDYPNQEGLFSLQTIILLNVVQTKPKTKNN